MRNLKAVFAVVAAAFPVIYCGYLVYYFYDVSGGSMQEVERSGLGPTLIGLGVVGLLFCIPLAVKIVRLIVRPRPPRSDSGGGPRPPTPHGGGESSFDADAVVARYLAQRQVEAASGSPAAPPAQGSVGAKRAGFGRKAR